MNVRIWCEFGRVQASAEWDQHGRMKPWRDVGESKSHWAVQGGVLGASFRYQWWRRAR